LGDLSKTKRGVVKGRGREEVEALYDKIVSTTSVSPQITEVVRSSEITEENCSKP